MRVLAHLSQDAYLIAFFQRKGDVHTLIAGRALGSNSSLTQKACTISFVTFSQENRQRTSPQRKEAPSRPSSTASCTEWVRSREHKRGNIFNFNCFKQVRMHWRRILSARWTRRSDLAISSSRAFPASSNTCSPLLRDRNKPERSRSRIFSFFILFVEDHVGSHADAKAARAGLLGRRE